MKKGKITVTITIAIACFVLAMVMSMQFKVVKETDLEAFPIQHDHELLIMYTCWPINRSVVGRKTQRLVVYAERVENNEN